LQRGLAHVAQVHLEQEVTGTYRQRTRVKLGTYDTIGWKIKLLIIIIIIITVAELRDRVTDTPVSYFGGPEFKTRPGDRLS
jgi:hypothetical protein